MTILKLQTWAGTTTVIGVTRTGATMTTGGQEGVGGSTTEITGAGEIIGTAGGTEGITTGLITRTGPTWKELTWKPGE